MFAQPTRRRPFIAPNVSEAHYRLIKSTNAAGFDPVPIRHLLRLVNAHPMLVAHARVFENLGEMFKTRIFSEELIGHLGDWQSYLPEWVRFCEWCAANAEAVSRRSGLDAFVKKERSLKDHPILSHGVGRHGVVTALWNRHEHSPDYPPDQTDSAPRRYFLLQAQLALSYIEARWRYSTLEFYERWEGPEERPIAPALSGAATRAIREFSFAKYDGFLAELKPGQGHEGFLSALGAFEGDISTLGDADAANAVRQLHDIQRYFRGFARVLEGKPPRHRTRSGGGGGPGRRTWRPGYIHFRTPGVVFTTNEPPHGGGGQGGTRAGIDNSPGGVDPKGIEASGLSPNETIEEVFNLIDPAELNGVLRKARYQRLAAEMSGQHFDWGLARLARFELRMLWATLEQAIAAPYAEPSNASVARYGAIAALVLKSMLLLGQPLAEAKDLRVLKLGPTDPFDPLDPTAVHSPTLVAQQAGDDADCFVAMGFLLPAIGPSYATDLDEEALELSHPQAQAVYLGDPAGLGAELLRFLASEARVDDRVFGIEAPKLKAVVDRLLGSIGRRRITVERIARALASRIVRQTGDQSLAWIATADQARADEPRMHYTRHRLDVLHDAHARAASDLLRSCGARVQNVAPLERSDDDVPSVGCRFVLRADELKHLVRDLKRLLTDHRRTPLERAALVSYNDTYVFYNYLFQAIWSSIRAITRPIELIRAWEEAGATSDVSATGLSDKTTRYFDNSRLVEISRPLAKQYLHYHLHLRALLKRLGLAKQWRELPPEEQPLLVISAERKLIELSPTWIEAQFRRFLGPVPANFHRAFLRTQLLRRGESAEMIDALLGHANRGEAPYGRFATYDFGEHRARIADALFKLSGELGLTPVGSRLCPYPTRLVLAR